MGIILSKLTPTNARVEELILSQYKQSPNLIGYIRAFVNPIQPILSSLDECIKSRSIHLAVGYSLDKIAKVVGEDRVFLGAAALGYFGFHEDPTALPLDEGIFYSWGETKTGDLILTDTQLRNLILARIILNTGGGRVEDIIEYCRLVVGREINIEVIEGIATVRVNIHEDLSVSEKLLLTLRLRLILPPATAVTLFDNNGEINVNNNIRG